MNDDERIAYGAACTWWGPIREVGASPSGLPGCPECGGVLFEVRTEAKWWAGVDRWARETADPEYREFIRWLRGRCIRWTPNELADLRNRGERPGPPIPKARAIFDADFKRDAPLPPIGDRLRLGDERRRRHEPTAPDDDHRKARRRAARNARRRNR